MQQRLGIARTLLHEPEILLLDEPYTGLDQTAAGILDELIHDAKGEGKTLILSTHQIWRASGLARRCLILSRGMLAWDGKTGDMNRRELSDAYQRHAGFGGGMSRGFWRAALAIVAKDLRVEMRSRELLSAMAIFALLCILVFSFALELDRVAREEAVSGVLWVTLIFASMLGLGRSLAGEIDGGTLDGLLLAPVSRRAIYAGKLLGNTLFTLLVGACLLLHCRRRSSTRICCRSRSWSRQPSAALAFAPIGTLTALLTLHARSREALLPNRHAALGIAIAAAGGAGDDGHIEPERMDGLAAAARRGLPAVFGFVRRVGGLRSGRVRRLNLSLRRAKIRPEDGLWRHRAN